MGALGIARGRGAKDGGVCKGRGASPGGAFCVVGPAHLELGGGLPRGARRAAAQRGVCVHLLGNSLASIDKPFAHAGYVNQKETILRMGIDLWEYRGPDMLHAKTILVDDCVVIGSYDLHPRSEHYDTETAVLVSDARITAAIRASMMQHFAGAMQVGRSPVYRETRGLTGSPRKARILKMQVFRLPALLLKKHL